jgi:polysaccharide export outer membrane protein
VDSVKLKSSLSPHDSAPRSISLRVHSIGILSLCLFSAAGLYGQAPPPQQPPQTEAPKPQAAKPPETAPAAKNPEETRPLAVDPKTFQIGAEDILFIQVWREQDFTRQAIVRPDGKITMPLIGEVQASGLTPDQLTTALAESLSKFLNNPQVNVTILAVNSKKYYITGEVNRPGAFPLAVPTKVLEALSSAGGFREFASVKKITILRKGQRLKFNYKDVIKGKNMDQNILLENGDYIIVP